MADNYYLVWHHGTGLNSSIFCLFAVVILEKPSPVRRHNQPRPNLRSENTSTTLSKEGVPYGGIPPCFTENVTEGIKPLIPEVIYMKVKGVDPGGSFGGGGGGGLLVLEL